MVGPVAVRPDVQRGGHGRALMDRMLESARTMADGALMMIGDPEYYGRFFGFTADATGAWDLPGPYEKHRLLALAVNGHDLPGGDDRPALTDRFRRPRDTTTRRRDPPCARGLRPRAA